MRGGLAAGLAAAAIWLVMAAPALADGPFFGPTNYTVGTNPQGIAAGKFFVGNPLPGIATADQGTNDVTVLTPDNSNPGSFLVPPDIWSAGTRPAAVAIGHLANSGTPFHQLNHLAVLNHGDSSPNSNTIAALFNGGLGPDNQWAFSNPQTTPIGGWPGTAPFAIALGDFRNSGNLDAIVTDQFQGVIKLMTNPNAVPVWSFGGPFSSTSVGNGPSGLATGDFNIDGNLDVVTANLNDNQVAVALGDGAGHFPTVTAFPAGFSPMQVTTGDFNGDRKLDAAAVDTGQPTISVLLGDGKGNLTPAPGSPVDTQPWPQGIAAADFNRDGQTDLAVSIAAIPGYGANGVAMFPGKGDGTFGPPQTTGLGSTAPDSLVSADFNFDGRPDVATAAPASSAVSVLLDTLGPPGWFFGPRYRFFGNQPVGTVSTAKSWTLGLTGSRGQVTFGAATLSGADADQFRITSDGCSGQTLLYGQNCTVSGVFAPTSAGDQTASINFSDDQGDVLTGALYGTGTAPSIGLSPSGWAFGNQLVGTTSATKQFTATNTGTAPLTISAVGLGGVDPGQYQISSNTCVTTLSPGASCTLDVAFAPNRQGQATATLTFTDNASGGQQTVPLSGVGTPPQIAVEPTSKDYGSVNAGGSTPAQTFTIANNSAGPLTSISAAIGGPDPGQYQLDSNTCTGPIPAGGTCTVSAHFAPTSQGIKVAEIDLGPSPGGGTFPVPLQGRGTEPGFGVVPATKDFGDQLVGTDSPAQLFTVTNTGTGPLKITSVELTGTDPEQFATEDDHCSGTTLPAGQQCTVRARFDPLRTGPASARLTFVDDAPGPDQQVPLLGVGTAPNIGIAPPDKAYGAQLVGTTSAPSTFTATNTGTAPLHVRGVTLLGHDREHFDLTSTNCPGATVPPGGTCTANVVFKPVDVGPQTAELVFTDNASGGEQRLPLSGFGISPSIGVAPNAQSFDDVQVGSTSSPAGFTATNTGGADLTIQSVGLVGTDASQFALAGNTCGGVTLHPGESCTVSARFQPTEAGFSSAFVAFTDNASGGQTRVGVAGFGTQPGAAITPETADLGSAQVGNRGPTVPLTVSDEGTAPLHISGVSLGGPNAGDVAIASDGCSGQTLSLGVVCTVQVQLAPGSAGQKSATLKVSDDAPNSPQSAALSGSATSGPAPSPPTPSPSPTPPPAPAPPVNVPLVPTPASTLLRSAAVRVNANGGFALPVRCEADAGAHCEGTLTLTTPKAIKKKKRGKRAARVRQEQVAAGRFSLSPGRGTIRLRVTRGWLARLKRTRRLATTATALTRRTGAAAARDTARVVLLAPERKKKKSKRR